MLKDIQVMLAIVNFGVGSKVLKIGQEAGLSGGTVFLGTGTTKQTLLQFLELNEVRKELVVMGGTREVVSDGLKLLEDRLHLSKPGKGIALSMPVAGIFGNGQDYENQFTDKGEQRPMYNLIYVIVDLGKSDDVLEAAKKAGSTGGTVINARGSGIHNQASKVFNMEIEPQKEIVMIISNSQKAKSITDSIREELNIDEPGHGVIFTMNVSEAHGLYSDEK